MGVLVNPDYTVAAAGGIILQAMPDADELVLDDMEEKLQHVLPVSLPQYSVNGCCCGAFPIGTGNMNHTQFFLRIVQKHVGYDSKLSAWSRGAVFGGKACAVAL